MLLWNRASPAVDRSLRKGSEQGKVEERFIFKQKPGIEGHQYVPPSMMTSGGSVVEELIPRSHENHLNQQGRMRPPVPSTIWGLCPRNQTVGSSGHMAILIMPSMWEN